MPSAARALAPHRHAVFRLAPGLLLVFKPRRHVEARHAHPHAQRLAVLRGRLAVATASGRIVLAPEAPPLVVPAGTPHATRALADTWLVAEAVAPAAARAAGARRSRRRLARVTTRRRRSRPASRRRRS